MSGKNKMKSSHATRIDSAIADAFGALHRDLVRPPLSKADHRNRSLHDEVVHLVEKGVRAVAAIEQVCKERHKSFETVRAAFYNRYHDLIPVPDHTKIRKLVIEAVKANAALKIYQVKVSNERPKKS